jgi:adenosylcobinamide-phosphate guanylyltransferase
MAGGKATRFDFSHSSFLFHEKPLIPLGDQYLIDYVLNAVQQSKEISQIFIATSPHTPKTFEILSARNQNRFKIVPSPGQSYHDDLKYIIKKFQLHMTLVLTTDIPTITQDDVDLFIHQFEGNKIPSLSVMCDLSSALSFYKNEIPPNHIYINSEGLSLVPVGINIIDGTYIDAEYIPQKEFIIRDTHLLHNINSIEDYKRILQYYPNGITNVNEGA